MANTQIAVVNTIIGQAHDLAKEHEDFYDGYIVAGRKALYDLLGKIYALSDQLNRAVDRDEQVDSMRSSLASQYGIRTQENTSDTTVLVRYITRADRKTAHVYSRAIEAARANGITSSDFAQYVEQAGGIERIRSEAATSATLVISNNSVSDEIEGMLEIAREYLRARSELPIASFKLSRKSPIIKSDATLKHYICQERNGRQYVLAQLPVSPEQETALVKDFAKVLCRDLRVSKRNIKKFHTKAMAKRKERTVREISKKRPELGARLMRSSISELKK